MFNIYKSDTDFCPDLHKLSSLIYSPKMIDTVKIVD